MVVWLIADDFTGANDSIVRFAMSGARSATIFDPLFRMEQVSQFHAVALNANSRGMSSEGAYQTNYAVIQRLALNEGDMVYKKVDSALRGNMGPEIDAILDGLGNEITALVAPALPDSQRSTLGGYQLIRETLVHETEMAADPVTPVRESHLPTLLARTSRRKIGYLPLGIISGGLEKTSKAFHEQTSAGCRIVVADACRNEHLDILAQLTVTSAAIILPCGSAGLAGALARRIFPPPGMASPFEATSAGPIAAIIGSKSRTAFLQLRQALLDLNWLTEIEVDRIAITSAFQGQDEIFRIRELAERAYANDRGGIIIRPDADPTIDPEKISASLLAAGLGNVARMLVEEAGVKTLYLSGGDITANAVSALGGWGLTVRAELESGVCLGNLQGGRFEGLPIITKAGSFGDVGTLTRVLRILRKNC